MQYYIHHNNEQIGPFTEAEVKAKLAAGEISASDHVWWQGQQGWVPLSQTPLAGASLPTAPIVPGAPAGVLYPAGVIAPSSKLAMWALICGCLSLVCSLFASIPAIILGHMGLKEIKKNPGMQGHGMALAGMILGYVFTALILVYIAIVGVSVAIALNNNQTKDLFNNINAQLKAAEATNSSSDSTTSSADQSTNSTSSTSPDSSTNSSTTNAPASTNSAPASH